MLIPYQKLPPETLDAVLDSVITREGTDYGDREWSLLEKRHQLKDRLASGELVLVFEASDESISVMSATDYRQIAPFQESSVV